MDISSFQTARLRAVRITPDHFDEICLLHRDPMVMKTLSADGMPLADEKTRDGLERQAAHWEQHGFGLWAFYGLSDGRFIGRGGLAYYEIDGKREVGLAYAVVSTEWNRGYATEIAEGCLDIGFWKLDFQEIASWTLPENDASQRVLRKLGFRYDRDFIFAGLPHRLYRLAKP